MPFHYLEFSDDEIAHAVVLDFQGLADIGGDLDDEILRLIRHDQVADALHDLLTHVAFDVDLVVRGRFVKNFIPSRTKRRSEGPGIY